MIVRVTRRSADEHEVARGRRLGAELGAMRRQANLTQEEMAQAAGLSVYTIQKIEGGARRSPELFSVVAIVGALGGSLDALVARVLEVADSAGAS